MCKNNATGQINILGHSGRHFSCPQGASKAAEVPGSALIKPDLEREAMQEGLSAVLRIGGARPAPQSRTHQLERFAAAEPVTAQPCALLSTRCLGHLQAINAALTCTQTKLYSFWSFPSTTNMYWENRTTLLVCWLIFIIIFLLLL